MRILVIHNYYGSEAPSGENAAVDAEVKLLRSRGNDVLTVTRSSDSIRGQRLFGAIAGGLSWLGNSAAASSVRKAARGFAPDIIHLHNTFPLFSNSILAALRGIAPRVLTLHNYRLVCPAAIPLREGAVCTLCIERRSGWSGVLHGCYRDSSLATAPLALRASMDSLYRTWQRQVEAFITLTEFQRQLMGKAGLPISRMHVRPNPYFGVPQSLAWRDREERVVFVGRLSAEKGGGDLVNAWRMAGSSAPPLRVIGDGPLRAELESRTRGMPVEFTGAVSVESARREIARARLIVVPSRWFEGFPLVISEALAHGTPLLVADVGPLWDIVSDARAGGRFTVGDPRSLWNALDQMWNDRSDLERLSRNALETYRAKYTEAAAYERLLQIYKTAAEGWSPRK